MAGSRRIMRPVTMLALFAFLLPLFAATAMTSAARQDVTEVTFWTTHGEPDLITLQEIVDQFNAEHPDIVVNLVQLPPAEVTDVAQLMTAVRGGTGPDVYMLDRFIVAQRAADGLLQDLSPYFEEAGISGDDYLEFAWAEANFEDTPYAMPFDTDTRALYYNKDMLRDAGIDPEELDPSNGPITLDRLKEIAMELNEVDEDGNYTQMGFVPWFSQGWHYTYGFAFGGEFFDEATCEVTPDNPQVVEAFQWVYDFAADLDPQQAQAFIQPHMQPGAPPQQNPFNTGRLAMMIVGDWHIRQMELYAPDIDYGITFIPVPSPEDEPSTWAGGWSMVMPEGAQEPDAAFEFMSFIAGEEGQRLFTVGTRHLPTLKVLQEESELYGEEHLFFAEELLPIAKNRPPLPVGARYWDELTVAWENTYLNQQTPEQSLETVRNRVQADLDQFC